MVATLLMPISILNEVTKTWFLQDEICDMRITFYMYGVHFAFGRDFRRPLFGGH